MPPQNRQSTACTDLTWLGPAEKELQFGRKDELWAQGSIAASVAQVTSGVVKLVRNWESGRRTLVGLASAGTIIGLELGLTCTMLCDHMCTFEIRRFFKQYSSLHYYTRTRL